MSVTDKYCESDMSFIDMHLYCIILEAFCNAEIYTFVCFFCFPDFWKCFVHCIVCYQCIHYCLLSVHT